MIIPEPRRPTTGRTQFWPGYELIENPTALGPANHEAIVQARLDVLSASPVILHNLTTQTSTYTLAGVGFYGTALQFTTCTESSSYPL